MQITGKFAEVGLEARETTQPILCILLPNMKLCTE